MSNGDENPNSIASIRYYRLTDENAKTFYDEWRLKTMAIIRKKGWFRPFEHPDEEIPTTTPASTASDEVKELFKSNEEAYDQVLMGCSGVPLGIVRRARGNVRLAFELLDEKFAEKDESNLTELLQEFTGCKLEDTETDPDVWFLKIDAINTKLKSINEDYEKKDYEMKAHLLGNLPAGYEDVKTKISGKEAEHTVRDIEREIAKKWKRDFADQVSAKTTSKQANVAFNVEARHGRGSTKTKWSGVKKFKGKCRKCGQQGHKATDCRSTKKVCFECGKEGHFARECPSKNKGEMGMFVGMHWCQTVADSKASKSNEATGSPFGKYLMDSGASCHVVGTEEGLVDLKNCKDQVLIGDNSAMQTTSEGTLYLETRDKVKIRLDQVKVVPGIAKDIISIGQLVKAGNKVEMDRGHMLLRNPSGNKILIEQRDQPLFYLEAKKERAVLDRHTVSPLLKSSVGNATESGWTMVVKGKNTSKFNKVIDINDAHELFGHISDGPLKTLLRERNYVIIGDRRSCEACAYAKAKAKGVSKSPSKPADTKGERLFIDISGPYKKTVKGNQFWVLVVDDKTRKAWSAFVPRKTDARKVFEQLVLRLKGANITVKYLRCDNAGENLKGIGEVCRDHGIQLELTAPYTPQTNGVVERKFVTIRDRAQAMMLGAQLSNDHQAQLWAEAVMTATKLHNAVPNQASSPNSPDMLWYGQHPRILDHLVQWGRVGYVKERGHINKLSPKSTKMVCMGYADDHAGDVYRMYNPDTGRVIESRDITWADWHGSQAIPQSLKMFAEGQVDVTDDYIGEDVPAPAPVTPAPIDLITADEEDDPSVGAGRKETGTPTVNPPRQGPPAPSPRPNRVARELAKLNTYYNPTMAASANDDAPEANAEAEAEVQAIFNVQLSSDPGEPKTFHEAITSSDRVKWIAAIKGELENFIKRKVWTPTKLTKLREGQKPIKVKWVFKKKQEQDGSTRCKGRIVVKGYVQIPGVDFTNTHSPVAQDSSIKVTLAIAMMFQDWTVEMIDIEAAFLEAELDEDIYIEWPLGAKEFGYFSDAEMDGTCLKLEKAMYGCVQSPLMFFKTYSKHLESMGLTQSLADPCIWFKQDSQQQLILLVAVYVDDCIVAGTKDEVESFKTGVKERFNITDLGPIKKHLGVWYEHIKDRSGQEYFRMTMEGYKNDILNDWKEITGKDPKPAKTPGFPGETLSKNQGDEVDKENYRKLLGRLMWFIRKLMPEALNSIRELAMYMDNPGEEHWRAMGRLVGYIAGQDEVELRLMKPRDFKVYAYVDSNYATNKETRKSVTGYFVTIGGCLVAAASKTQPSVTLSSTEAEYIAASMCATEIKFIQMLLEELMPTVETRPATLFEDNTGAIFLMENQAVGNRTKHIDIRWHHLRSLMRGENPRLQVVFTRSENNFADLATKNVTENVHTHLASQLKDGRIAQVIFDNAEREDVKNRHISFVDHFVSE
jgi:hypothetical protein